jgi:hypothetical protein
MAVTRPKYDPEQSHEQISESILLGAVQAGCHFSKEVHDLRPSAKRCEGKQGIQDVIVYYLSHNCWWQDGLSRRKIA